jgi:hypothetical protein
MRNILELTKREQRVVIVIVTLLVAFAFAKHWWQTKSQPVPAATTLSPATSLTGQPPKDESESDDQR